MKRRILIVAAAAAAVLALALGAGAGSPQAKGGSTKFDLKNLVGSWKGGGMFLMPITDVEIDLEGQGKFVFDTKRNLLKTAMSGTKYFLSYADSGLLRHDPQTDSVTWEIWDNWGKYAKYRGEIRDGRLVADRTFKDEGYQVTVNFPHVDTLDFRLTLTDPETQVKETRARFVLWRGKGSYERLDNFDRSTRAQFSGRTQRRHWADAGGADSRSQPDRV